MAPACCLFESSLSLAQPPSLAMPSVCGCGAWLCILGTAFSNAVAPMVGQNIGANRIDRAEKSAQLGSILAAVVVTFIGIFLFTIPEFFIGWFTNEPEVTKIGSVYFTLSRSDICIHGCRECVGSRAQRGRRYGVSDDDYRTVAVRGRINVGDCAFPVDRVDRDLVGNSCIKCCSMSPYRVLVQTRRLEKKKAENRPIRYKYINPHPNNPIVLHGRSVYFQRNNGG